MRVNIFVTCLTDIFHPEVGERLVALLERLGCEVVYPEGQTCCGQPAYNSGYPDEARPLARHFVETFGPLEGHIVAPFGSCVHMVRHAYPKLLEGESQLAQQAAELAGRTSDFCSFLVDALGRSDVGGLFPGRAGAKVAYHDECHLARGLGVSSQPRQLIERVEGCELLELEGDELCCGFGGTFSVKHGDTSTAMADAKIDRYLEAGADAIVSTDVGCLMQLEGRVRRRGVPLEVYHLLELLQPEGALA